MERKECRKCQSKLIVKAGFKKLAERKVQRFKCQECWYCLAGQEWHRRLSLERVGLIYRMYEEKGTIRKIARVLGATLKAVQYHSKKR